MRTPFIAANWKMYKTVHEAVVFVKEFRSLVKDVTDVEIVRRAAVHRAACGRRGGTQLERRRRRTEPALGARGRVHRRDQRRHAEGGWRRVRDHRPLGAAAAVRRDRPDRQPEGWSPRSARR